MDNRHVHSTPCASLVGTNGDDARLVVGGHRCLFGRDVGRTGPPWRPRRPGAPTPQTPRAAAPLDLTGSWVAVISEDWRWRMVTPAKGDYVSIPITQAQRTPRYVGSGERHRRRSAVSFLRSAGTDALANTSAYISWRDDTTMLVNPITARRRACCSSCGRARAVVARPLRGDLGPCGGAWPRCRTGGRGRCV